ncbi:phosphoglycerate mutase-like protein [Microthyrium microscopicum]|uniref:Phosphoglycerate mutase-like protein n=1 Tax=Microthyrium microscopicum TaxID=703497 RepID=A0A6A6UAT9_9PEZI|nr:phosphoglycerate mutase-like protein [Microthyrium microscopicum]
MQLRFFLVRHGETVDNVANIIAGVRDSQLTNHGFQQATRLGQYLNASGIDITHVFASPLQRATITAQQIILGQPEKNRESIPLIPAPSLREQDYGLLEGARYDEYRRGGSGMASVETNEMMTARAAQFIDEFLEPVANNLASATVVIVSHGRFLCSLWPQLLSRFNPETIICDQQLMVASNTITLQRIGAWSNTGYLEAMFERDVPEDVSNNVLAPPAIVLSQTVRPELDEISNLRILSSRWNLRVSAINSLVHLQGFKKTRGIGSARYDSRQSTLDKFFPGQRSSPS